MTEAKWLACTDPMPMLEFLRSKASVRKLRLFACCCCRRIDNLLTDTGKGAVVAAEGFAEGRISREQMHDAWKAVGYPKALPRRYAAAAARAASCSPGYDGTANAIAFAANASGCQAERKTHGARESELAAQAALFRDILGNPFRTISLDPTWLTPTVLALAQAAFDNRAPPSGTLDNNRLAVLADALEDAGCTDTEILAHLRSRGLHVRGCHVLDKLLGKA